MTAGGHYLRHSLSIFHKTWRPLTQQIQLLPVAQVLRFARCSLIALFFGRAPPIGGGYAVDQPPRTSAAAHGNGRFTKLAVENAVLTVSIHGRRQIGCHGHLTSAVSLMEFSSVYRLTTSEATPFDHWRQAHLRGHGRLVGQYWCRHRQL